MRRSGRPRPPDRKSPHVKPPTRLLTRPLTRPLERKSPIIKNRTNVWVNARQNLGLPEAVPKFSTDCSFVDPKPVRFSSDISKSTDEIFVPIPIYSASPLITPYSTPPRRLITSEEDPCPLSSASRLLENRSKISTSLSFPVVRRLHFESEPINLDCLSDISSDSLFAEDQKKSVQQAIQMKSDIMIDILNKTWSIEDKHLRVNEILRLLIDTQKELTTRMLSEYKIISCVNYIDAQKLFAMYSKLLSYIMAEINLYENS